MILFCLSGQYFNWGSSTFSVNTRVFDEKFPPLFSNKQNSKLRFKQFGLAGGLAAGLTVSTERERERERGSQRQQTSRLYWSSQPAAPFASHWTASWRQFDQDNIVLGNNISHSVVLSGEERWEEAEIPAQLTVARAVFVVAECDRT